MNTPVLSLFVDVYNSRSSRTNYYVPAAVHRSCSKVSTVSMLSITSSPETVHRFWFHAAALTNLVADCARQRVQHGDTVGSELDATVSTVTVNPSTAAAVLAAAKVIASLWCC